MSSTPSSSHHRPTYSQTLNMVDQMMDTMAHQLSDFQETVHQLQGMKGTNGSNGTATKKTPSKRKAESSSSSSSSDSDAPPPPPRKSIAPATTTTASTPNKKKAATSSSSSSSDSDSDAPPPPPRKSVAPTPAAKKTPAKKSAAASSTSSSSSSSSDSDSSPPQKKSTPAPAPIKQPVSDTMFNQYGFVLPSGLPPTAESLAKEAATRQAMLEAAREQASKAANDAKAARVAAANPPAALSSAAHSSAPSAALIAAQDKLRTISAKQAAALTKVAKLNAAQVAKLDATALENYRLARAAEKLAKKQMRREMITPEEKQALKVQQRKERKEAAKLAQEAKDSKKQDASHATEEAKPKKEAKPLTPVIPAVPSSSAATNPALKAQGLRKKDESVRAQERAERKRARRIAMGLPPEEEKEEEKMTDVAADDEEKKESTTAVTPAAEEHPDTTSHKRKLDEMRDARMQAVADRETAAVSALTQRQQQLAGNKNKKLLVKQEESKTPSASATTPSTSVTITSKPGVTSTTTTTTEVSAALQAKPLWMVRGRQISSLSSVTVDGFSFDPRIISVLKKQGIEKFFATQSELLPVILKSYGTNDICCCAPTGSGKTLTYCLPILEALSKRVITRLRCLILVPSRDLAQQVLKVLTPFASVLGLKVECILGQSSFVAEQEKLVVRDEYGRSVSGVDMLIATPGRLMDHLSAAEISAGSDQQYNFHLHDLQYLIIDEVDRLLTQGYQEWPTKVLKGIYETTTNNSSVNRMDGVSLTSGFNITPDEIQLEQRSIRRRFVSTNGATSTSAASSLSSILPLQKLLFSATLTNNPQKLASLHLHNPLFFTESTSSQRKFQLPVNLKQWVVNVTDQMQKPVVLIQLLMNIQKEVEKKNAGVMSAARRRGMDEENEGEKAAAPTSASKNAQILIFTSSIESTHRLYRLLECMTTYFNAGSIAEFSSALTQKERAKIIKKFVKGECNIIICSDAMSRGMDMSNVDVVINYDVPTFIQTYVHRVGRTARAGASGTSYTLVKSHQFRNFTSLLHQADNSFYSVHPSASTKEVQDIMPTYQQGLIGLKCVLMKEKQQEQSMHQPMNAAVRAEILASAAASSSISAADIDSSMNADLEDTKPTAAATEAGQEDVDMTPVETAAPTAKSNKAATKSTAKAATLAPTPAAASSSEPQEKMNLYGYQKKKGLTGSANIERPKPKKIKLSDD